MLAYFGIVFSYMSSLYFYKLIGASDRCALDQNAGVYGAQNKDFEVATCTLGTLFSSR